MHETIVRIICRYAFNKRKIVTAPDNHIGAIALRIYRRYADHIEMNVCPYCGRPHKKRWALRNHILGAHMRELAEDAEVERALLMAEKDQRKPRKVYKLRFQHNCEGEPGEQGTEGIRNRPGLRQGKTEEKIQKEV